MAALHPQPERGVITKLIQEYKCLPCLWDFSAESYKDKAQKKIAWDILVNILKELEPNANEASAKKKIDQLKSSYLRELRKIKKSKSRIGFTPADVHKPNLWYFNLLTFLNKIYEAQLNEKESGADSHRSDDEEEPLIRVTKRKKLSKQYLIKAKHSKSTEYKNTTDTVKNVPEDSRKEKSSFGIYVAEKLDEIPDGQRFIAEKLISDVIFLAKTNNLNYDSKIETPSKSRLYTSDSHGPSRNSSSSFKRLPPSTDTSQNYTSNQSPPHILQSHSLGHSYSPQSSASSITRSPIQIQSPQLSSQVRYSPHLSPTEIHIIDDDVEVKFEQDPLQENSETQYSDQRVLRQLLTKGSID